MKKNISILLGVALVLISLTIVISAIKTNQVSDGKRVAFVIDDWGYNRKNLDIVSQIDRPLTIAILPNLRYSEFIASEVKKGSNLHDLILHLPLESKSNIAAEENTIRIGMREDEILSILDSDINSIPGIIGISSHQGSLATEDEDLMSVIMSELKNRDLFFLDSMTTGKTISEKIARAKGVAFAERSVFLDVTDKTDYKNFEGYVDGQIRELVSIALSEGSAIGIGHNKKITLEVIRDSISEIEEQGIKIVPLKELVR